jgi:hypothetical protein
LVPSTEIVVGDAAEPDIILHGGTLKQKHTQR